MSFFFSFQHNNIHYTDTHLPMIHSCYGPNHTPPDGKSPSWSSKVSFLFPLQGLHVSDAVVYGAVVYFTSSDTVESGPCVFVEYTWGDADLWVLPLGHAYAPLHELRPPLHQYEAQTHAVQSTTVDQQS